MRHGAALRDCNPGPKFSIPGFGIGTSLIPGSRRDYGASVFGTHVGEVHNTNHYLLYLVGPITTVLVGLQQSYIRTMDNYADLRHT
jgi:hypothetical protein